MCFLKRIPILIPLVLLTVTAFGQKKNIYAPADSFWYGIDTDKYQHFSLPSVQGIKSTFSWRLLLSGGAINYAIEVSRSADSTYKGRVVFYTHEYVNENEEKPTHRYFGETAEIAPNISVQVFKLIQDMHINNIPTADDIKNWRRGLDGCMYYVEFTDGERSSYKSYWSPAAFKNITEAVLLNDFIDKLEVVVNMKYWYSHFSSYIPFESFHSPQGSTIGSKELSKRQRIKYLNERDRFRKEHHYDK